MRPDVPAAPRCISDDQADVLEALRLLLKPEGYVIDTAQLAGAGRPARSTARTTTSSSST